VPGGIQAGLPDPTERFLAICVETCPQLQWLDRFYHGSRTWADGPFPRWLEDWLNCVEVGLGRGAEGVVVRDTRARSGPVLRVSPGAWRTFAGRLKADPRPRG
jgi:hypothetical protein